MMNNSMRISLISPHPVVMMNTSFPRTDSWIWTDVSPLLNLPRIAAPSDTPRRLQIDLVRVGWEEPPRITRLRIVATTKWFDFRFKTFELIKTLAPNPSVRWPGMKSSISGLKC